MADEISPYLKRPIRSLAEVEAQLAAQAGDTPARVALPERYWANVYVKDSTGALVIEGHHLSEADAVADVAEGYVGLSYLHTIVTTHADRDRWVASVIDLGDAAEEHKREARAEADDWARLATYRAGGLV